MAQNRTTENHVTREVCVSEGKVSFIKDQIGTFEDCTVEYNHNTAKVLMRGAKDKVNARYREILMSLNEIHEKCIELTLAQKTILSTEEGRLFLNNFLSNYQWHFRAEELGLVVLTKNDQELGSCIQALTSRLNGKEHVPFDGEVTEARLLEIEKDLDLLVKLSHDKDCITIEGVTEDVAIAKREILELRDEFLFCKEEMSVDGQEAIFIKSHLSDEFDNLFSGLAVEKRFNQHGELFVSLKGTKSKIAEVKRKFNAFVSSVTSRTITFCLDQSQSYLLSKGKELYQDKMKTIERERKCSIVFPVNSTEVTETAFLNNDLGSNTDIPASGEIVKNLSNSCKLHIKHSKDITDETSDVLVCPINEKTSQHTAVLNRFKDLCPGIIEELASEKGKNPSSRTYVTRQSLGNLRCKAVVHVVLKKLRDPSSDQDLEQQIVNALQQAVAQGTEAKSVSFPVMGYGRAFKFSVQSAARIAVDAVKRFVTSAQTSSLTDIVFLAPEDTLFKQFQQCLGSSSAPAAEKRRAPPVNFDVLVAGTKDTDFTQLRSEIWRVFEVTCLGHEEYTHNFPENLSHDFHVQVEELAKQFGVLVEKSKTNKAGYRVSGTTKGRQQLIEAIKKIQIKFENKMIFFKEKRGSVEFIKHAAVSDDKFPSYWLQNSSNRDQQAIKRVDVDKKTAAAITDMTKKLFDGRKVGLGKDARGLSHNNIKVIKIERLENCHLFESYEVCRRRLLKKMAKQEIACLDISKLKSQSPKESFTSGGGVASTENLESFIKTELLCHEINEHYLFHGCNDFALEDILNNGFDFRLGSEGGMFGKGVYFAENPTKADQYADGKDSRSSADTKLTMILARVLLGDPFLCGKVFVGGPGDKKLVRPPCKTCFADYCRCPDKKFFDSVMGQGWLFREFVIYEKHVCYPEYIITYVRV
ncbi:uncharacterized protein LOC101851403 [Aplysia californica]|uniref:Poly [ADP-ribose] polymerase n=1 Tax=Aplysia californica TaxID=6500 RepID=A0ABM0JLX5_APLCA|nr:uncharacterized protein LOC101851403 [Aplysia californica]